MRIVPYQVQCYVNKYSSISPQHILRTLHKFGCCNYPRSLGVHARWVRFQYRGAKSKATVKVRDLPQGLLEDSIQVLEREDEGPIYPTVIQQARNNMRKFENCVVLTRMGGFYEVCQRRAVL